MSNSVADCRYARLGCARIATTALFLCFGFWIGLWVSGIPGLKAAFDLDSRQLGLLILLSGIGDLGMAIPMGKLIDKVGPKAILINTGCVATFMYAWLPWMASQGWSPYVIIFSLSTYSAGGAVAANHRASELEMLWDKPIMSSFHAAFSVGGVLGSATYALLLTAGLTWSQAFPMLAILVVVCNLAAASFMDRGMKNFISDVDECLAPSPAQVLLDALTSPKAAINDTKPSAELSTSLTVLCLGSVCFLTLMTEGAVGDWSSLYFIQEAQTPLYRAPLGYSVYATAMGALRFLGDELIALYGRRKVFRLGAVTAMSGVGLLLAIPSFKVGLLACILTGVGMSNMMPILMSTAGRLSKGNAGVTIATMSVMGQCGLMGGPAIIGFIAHHAQSLRLALCTLLGTTGLILSATPLIQELRTRVCTEETLEGFESAKACFEDLEPTTNRNTNASSPEFNSIINVSDPRVD